MEGRFPTAARYLARMPEGVSSYPELQVHTAGLGKVREVIEGPYDDLPGPLAAYFRYEVDDAWVPEVLGQTTTLMLVDAIGEPALIRRSRQLAEELYSGPVLRRLIRLLSPTLVVMGTQRRWGAMRRGTTMTATPVETQGRTKLSHIAVEAPHPVLTEPFARALQPFIELAIESSRGREPFVTIREFEPTRIVYAGRWR